jgi:hypothetical protein
VPASLVQLDVVAAAGASLGAIVTVVIVAGHETAEIAGQHSRGVRSEETHRPGTARERRRRNAIVAVRTGGTSGPGAIWHTSRVSVVMLAVEE